MKKCEALTKRKQPCKNWAKKGNTMCNAHAMCNAHVMCVTQGHTHLIKLPLKIKKFSYSGWINSLLYGTYEQIVSCVSNYDINELYYIYPNTDNCLIHPLFEINRIDILYQLIQSKYIDSTIINHNHMSFLRKMLYSTTIEDKYHSTYMSIIRELCRNENIDFHRDESSFGSIYEFIFSNKEEMKTIYAVDGYDDDTRCQIGCILLQSPKIQINREVVIWRENAIRGTIGHILSQAYSKSHSEYYLRLLRVVLSRNDIDINLISLPDSRLIPYLNFCRIKQKLRSKAGLLPKPRTWTPWQEIAYKLQKPPLSQEDEIKLEKYYSSIGGDSSCRTPIQFCVALAKHYEHYNMGLTYNHNLAPLNDCDLCGNSFAELPREHIIVDDDNYAFDIYEIDKILKSKKHPYTGKEWASVTINGQNIKDYVKNHPIDPIYWTHHMSEPVEDRTEIQNKLTNDRLMRYFPQLTPQLCQTYSSNNCCREALIGEILGNYHVDELSYDDFAEIIVSHVTAFHEGLERDTICYKIMDLFVVCQVYAIN